MSLLDASESLQALASADTLIDPVHTDAQTLESRDLGSLGVLGGEVAAVVWIGGLWSRNDVQLLLLVGEIFSVGSVVLLVEGVGFVSLAHE